MEQLHTNKHGTIRKTNKGVDSIILNIYPQHEIMTKNESVWSWDGKTDPNQNKLSIYQKLQRK